MPSPSRALPALALLGLAPLALSAQDSTTTAARVDSGAVVRVTAPQAGLDRVRARAVASRGDSLHVRRPMLRYYRDSVDVAIAWRDVTELAVSRGVDRGAGARRGALTGALVVGVPGAAATAGLLWYDWRRDQHNRCYEWCYLGPVVMGVLTVGGTATGAIVGALIGAGTGRERWERTGIPARVGFVPTPDGFGVRLAF